MKRLFDRLSLGSGLFLAAAILFDLVAYANGANTGVTAAAFALFFSVFFCLIVPSAVLYTIIKLAVRDAKR